MKVYSVIAFLAFALVVTVSAEAPLNSRAIQNLGCNCLFNDYIQEELLLGLQYLNASMYMFHDRLALDGFGKMFRSFWREQHGNANNIRKYLIKRGGLIETPYYKLVHDSHDIFADQYQLVERFLRHEKRLNEKLLELHGCASGLRHEDKCRVKKRKIYKSTFGQGSPDIHATQFLDDNFTKNKVERLKFLADLARELSRFDLHRVHNGQSFHVGANMIGVHLVDRDLSEKFSS